MESDPLFVSAIIPVYNGETFLAEAVASIQRQNYKPLEIIIVDDGSTDNTAAIARNFGDEVQYLFQPNRGAPAARNHGLKMARGDVITFQDADDLWPENRLNLQLACLAKNPSTEIVLGHSHLFRMVEDINGKTKFEKLAYPAVDMSLGSAAIRRSVFDKVGLLDEKLRHCDDWDWFMRARELGISMTVLEEVTRYYRRHEHNITNEKKTGDHYTLLMLKKSLDRRRRQSKTATSLQSLSSLKREDQESLKSE